VTIGVLVDPGAESRNAEDDPLSAAYATFLLDEPNWDAAEPNWFSANLRVAAALAERGYDLRLVLGDGGHSPNHGGAILPDALRCLWRPGAA
jgi:hypothetical protein